jgi:hypothetical protein
MVSRSLSYYILHYTLADGPTQSDPPIHPSIRLSIPTTTQDASTEDIKRAYKRKSLALHPDKLAQRGQVLTPEDQARVRISVQASTIHALFSVLIMMMGEQFQRVKEAYEVLVDAKRRDLYDECVDSFPPPVNIRYGGWVGVWRYHFFICIG